MWSRVFARLDLIRIRPSRKTGYQPRITAQIRIRPNSIRPLFVLINLIYRFTVTFVNNYWKKSWIWRVFESECVYRIRNTESVSKPLQIRIWPTLRSDPSSKVMKVLNITHYWCWKRIRIPFISRKLSNIHYFWIKKKIITMTEKKLKSIAKYIEYDIEWRQIYTLALWMLYKTHVG